MFNPIPHGGIFPSTAWGGINLTHTYLTPSEGPIRHILCNIIEGTFKGDHQRPCKKNSTISQKLTELLQFLSRANFSFLVSGNQPTTNPKLNMAIAQSFLKIQSSSFLQTSPFFMWKRILH